LFVVTYNDNIIRIKTNWQLKAEELNSDDKE